MLISLQFRELQLANLTNHSVSSALEPTILLLTSTFLGTVAEISRVI